ncbi:MAG: hypothetical protein CVV41_16950 [Candidatus Riflebacteria bacterium HGW-Riflebacteria-1]|jgi:vacuolar-type H+-ATPase subunit I/STV1|nr:MAG: hypothetical protein CVV41_16950 [Candidatus Riflebacteria bacterium HGW-Riflebacteria-1]
MGSLLLLIGLLLFMMSLIWTTGEALKKDLIYGAMALVATPIYSGYFAFQVDYKKWSRPFFISMAGLLLSLVGYLLG